jgi:tetratricopeptide (TPR) repeat protein
MITHATTWLRRSHAPQLFAAAALVAALFAAALPSQARAQKSQREREASYEKLVNEALQEFTAGSWVEAYTLFSQAHELVPNARTERGMGIAAYEMRDYPKAITHLEASLKQTNRPLTEAQRRNASETLERARRLVGELVIDVKPENAAVFLGGKPASEGRMLVAVGEAHVRVEAEGFQPVERTLQIKGGQQQTLRIALQPLASSLSETAIAYEQPEARTRAVTADDDGSVFESPWLWIGAAVVVAGGVVTAVLLTSDDDGQEIPEGNLGTTVTALTFP